MQKVRGNPADAQRLMPTTGSRICYWHMDHYLQVLYPINGASKQCTSRTLSLRPILHKLFAARLECQRRQGNARAGYSWGPPSGRQPEPPGASQRTRESAIYRTRFKRLQCLPHRGTMAGSRPALVLVSHAYSHINNYSL